jgi:hypothetical protein
MGRVERVGRVGWNAAGDITIPVARVQAAACLVTADRTVVPSHGNHLEAPQP